MCFRALAPSANSYRFNKGWLSHSTVAGFKAAVFNAARELANGCRVDNAVER